MAGTRQQNELQETFARPGFVAASPANDAYALSGPKSRSASDTMSLLQGETGTGKQVIARAVHQRDGKPA